METHSDWAPHCLRGAYGASQTSSGTRLTIQIGGINLPGTRHSTSIWGYIFTSLELFCSPQGYWAVHRKKPMSLHYTLEKTITTITICWKAAWDRRVVGGGSLILCHRECHSSGYDHQWRMCLKICWGNVRRISITWDSPSLLLIIKCRLILRKHKYNEMINWFVGLKW